MNALEHNVSDANLEILTDPKRSFLLPENSKVWSPPLILSPKSFNTNNGWSPTFSVSNIYKSPETQDSIYDSNWDRPTDVLFFNLIIRTWGQEELDEDAAEI